MIWQRTHTGDTQFSPEGLVQDLKVIWGLVSCTWVTLLLLPPSIWFTQHNRRVPPVLIFFINQSLLFTVCCLLILSLCFSFFWVVFVSSSLCPGLPAADVLPFFLSFLAPPTPPASDWQCYKLISSPVCSLCLFPQPFPLFSLHHSRV